MSYYGRPITLQQANSQIKHYLALKQDPKVQEQLKNMSNDLAREYYLGEELSFVFEKDIVTEMFKIPFCNGVRIYYASLDQQETREMKKGHDDITLPEGTPTLVLVPCNIQPDGYVKNLMQDDEEALAACEHPGLIESDVTAHDFNLRNDS